MTDIRDAFLIVEKMRGEGWAPMFWEQFWTLGDRHWAARFCRPVGQIYTAVEATLPAAICAAAAAALASAGAAAGRAKDGGQQT